MKMTSTAFSLPLLMAVGACHDDVDSYETAQMRGSLEGTFFDAEPMPAMSEETEDLKRRLDAVATQIEDLQHVADARDEDYLDGLHEKLGQIEQEIFDVDEELESTGELNERQVNDLAIRISNIEFATLDAARTIAS